MNAVASAAGASLSVLLALAGVFKAVVSGWTFQLSPRSWRNVASGAPTIMIFKFCNRSLEKLVEETSAWSWPGAGALPHGDLAATRKAIADIFSAAKARADDPDVPLDDPYSVFYRNIVQDWSWNGI